MLKSIRAIPDEPNIKLRALSRESPSKQPKIPNGDMPKNDEINEGESPVNRTIGLKPISHPESEFGS